MESSETSREDLEQLYGQLSTSEQTPTKVDNFFSPYNREFYSRHRYAELDASQQEMRLLRIQTENCQLWKTDPVQCELIENVRLADMAGKFSTISYCAGDPKHTRLVIVNGIPFNAFSRLSHAIQQARHFWFETYNSPEGSPECLLWADQICIDQSNPAERSHQVGLMGDIYGAAEQVLISLTGEEDEAGGIGWLNRIVDEPQWSERRHQIIIPSHQYRKSANLHSGHEAFLRVILGNPYWKRAWIHQEYIRSCTGYILAAFEYANRKRLEDVVYGLRGKFLFAYSHCNLRVGSQKCRACRCAETVNHSIRTIRENTIPGLSRHHTTYHLIPDKRKTLPECLYLARQCEASDPRDLFYAFLSISSHNFNITPDYSPHVTATDVVCRLSKNLINSYGAPVILSMCRGLFSRKPFIDGPSWTLDPHETNAHLSLERLPVSPRANLAISFLPDEQGCVNRILQVRGYFLTTLAQPNEPPSSSDLLPDEQRFWTENGNIINSRGQCRTGDGLWWVYGYIHALILRSYGQNFQVVGYAVIYLDPRGISQSYFTGSQGPKHVNNHWSRTDRELIQMVEHNDPLIQVVNIC